MATASPGSANKAPKVNKACERCRTMKVRCSGLHPCARCERAKKRCVFGAESKRISVSESYLRRLESRGSHHHNTPDSISLTRRHHNHHLATPDDASSNGGGPRRHNRPPSAVVPLGDEALQEEIQRDSDTTPRRGESSLSSSGTSGVGSPFRQNPLADNDYTFAKMNGRFWYMGPSSSWSFCRRVLALLGKRLPESVYSSDPGHFDGGAFRLRWRPVAADEVPDVSNLPPLDYALFLFNTAKFYLGTVFHVIDEREFLDNLHELYEDTAAKAARDRHWYAQFLLIMAYGKAFVVGQSGTLAGMAGPPSGYQYAARAMALMPDLAGLAPVAIHAVQALVLGALYLQSIDMRVGALQHLGLALRIAIVEGWHRHMPEEVVGFEYSRRCNIIFWMVYILDREFGPLIGAPSSIRDDDITAKIPAELDSSLEAQNMSLNIRLSRLMARILTEIYGVGKKFDGSLVANTQEVLRDLAQLSKDLNSLLNAHFQGSISKASRMALRLILSYHHCVVLTTRPLVMCALHMHMEQTDSSGFGSITFSPAVNSLLQSCIDSAETVLRTLRVIGDEDLLEAFLPFQLEDAFSSAFILHLMHAISPQLVQDQTWKDDIECVLDKMISKGSVVAPLRKAELRQLELNMRAFAPPRSTESEERFIAAENAAAANTNNNNAAYAGHGHGHGDGSAGPHTDSGMDPGHDHHHHVGAVGGHGHDAFPQTPPVTTGDVGWDLFMEHGAVGIPPDQMLDLAAQLEVDHDYVSHVW